jgi:hypothetical protein
VPLGPRAYTATPGTNIPALAVFSGPFLELKFQDGPVEQHGVNGLRAEQVLRAIVERIESIMDVEDGRYRTIMADEAVWHLDQACTRLTESADFSRQHHQVIVCP